LFSFLILFEIELPFAKSQNNHLTLKSRQITDHPFKQNDYESIYYESEKTISIRLKHELLNVQKLGSTGDGSYELYNVYEYYYIGQLFLGSAYQFIPLIWDTGSEWFVIESSECETCKGANYYDYSGDLG